VNYLRPNRRKDRNKDEAALQFMEFAVTLPCLCCHFAMWKDWLREPAAAGRLTALMIVGARQRGVEFAHIGGNMAAKASNWHGVPLCKSHHTEGPLSEHALKGRFGAYWGLDIEAIIAQLNAVFRELDDF
jgi:hypothetical protein